MFYHDKTKAVDVMIKFSDPWKLGELIKWKELEASAFIVHNESCSNHGVFITLKTPFFYESVDVKYLLATPRYENGALDQLQLHPLSCNFIRITQDEFELKKFNSDKWRGGIGFIGDLELNSN